VRFFPLQRTTQTFCIISTCLASAHGFVDNNNNGLSDIWEMEKNSGLLFSANNPAHLPTSDPDQDGWTNAQECLAGTHPFDGSIPRGKTTLRITKAVEKGSFEVSWPVVPGKSYRLQTSSDLLFWANIGPSILAEAGEAQRSIGLQTSNLNGTNASPPTKLYWRIKVADRDEDGDGLSTADEIILRLNPLQAQTSPGTEDTTAVDLFMNHHPGGFSGKLPGTDYDDDGLNSFQEYGLGTDPNKADTDDDGKKDGEDAVPLDKEIDWLKAAEPRYTWLEQVPQVTSSWQQHRPVAINNKEQILFRDSRNISINSKIQEQKNLWDSATQQWVNLPLSGSQTIKVATRDVAIAEPAIEFIDINDDGVIFGVGRGEDFSEVDPIVPGMVWKRSGTSLTTYSPPKYFFPLYPFPAPVQPATWSTSIVSSRYSIDQGELNNMLGGIANDGTINAICSGTGVGFNVWMNYASEGTSPSMTTVKVLSENVDVSQTFPAAVLDKDHSLCVECIETSTGVFQSKVWLKEGSSKTDISFMTNQVIENAELQITPNTKKDGTKRLWVAIEGECYVEKPKVANGNDRWHEPACLAEDVIRLSHQGIAITGGNPTATVGTPPKLWRNGKFLNMNHVVIKPLGSTLVITKAIDLSSNGIILVQAMENGIIKTGILKPIP
jgi:hypothetical protein